MFKSRARWRSDKKKIKIVFKLQFQVGVVGNALSVCLTPADDNNGNGKPTLRLGTDKPFLETINFSQDSKTGKIHHKFYHFQVSDGVSKVGEACLDFAEYADAIQPCFVSLPLNISNAVLHVSIQRLQVHQRSETALVKVEGLTGQCGSNDTIHHKAIQDASCNKNNNNTGLNLISTHSGSDILSSSGSSSGFDTPTELALITTDAPISFLPSPTPTNNQRSHSEWSVGTDQGLSIDDSTQGTLPSPQTSDMEIKKLKCDLLVFARRAEMSDLELQTIRKQIVKESKKGQDLLKEVVSLKKERDALKEECERNKALKKRQEDAKIKNRLQFERGNSLTLFEELRQELDYEKDLNQNLRRQLQKTQESNAELILAVRDLDEMLERINDDDLVHYKKSAAGETARQLLESKCHSSDEDEEQKELDELVKEHKVGDETCLLEQRVTDQCREIEIYRRDRDELEMQLEQLALDYEILKQENHDILYKLQQSDLQDQLKMQFECSGSFAMMNELETKVENQEIELRKQLKELANYLATITNLETYVASLEDEMDKQTQGFEADLEAVMKGKVEQEQRAIRAEEALKTTRFRNANTAARLQEEFQRLSTQMFSTFDANEKLATKALTEANELRLQKIYLEETLKKTKEELLLVKEARLHEKSAQSNVNACEIKETLLEMKGEIDRLTKENIILLEHVEEKKTMRAELEKTTQELEKEDTGVKKLFIEAQPHGSKEVANLLERIKLLEGQVKLKEAALDASANTFLEKENYLQNKIKQVESRLEELLHHQSSSTSIEKVVGKSVNGSEEINEETLRLRNSSMERELKEMQERYSEISVMFAQVEGERQELVMTVRNLRKS